MATKCGVPPLPSGAISDQTNQVVPPRVTAKEAPPESLLRPRHLSVTLTSGGSTSWSPSSRGCVTYSVLVWLPGRSGGADVRQTARNGGPSSSLCPTQRSVVNVPCGSLKTFQVRQWSQETSMALRVLPSRTCRVTGL